MNAADTTATIDTGHPGSFRELAESASLSPRPIPLITSVEPYPAMNLKASIRKRWVRWLRLDRCALYGLAVHLDRRVMSPRMVDVVAGGTYESAEVELMRATLRRDDRYLELGAGIGLLGMLATRITGGGEAVTLVEANPGLIPLIERNLEANGCKARLIHGAVAVSEGELEFCIGEDFWAGSVGGESGKKIRVPAIEFARLLAKARPSYLMIDIEGGEVDLLAGAPLPAFVKKICMEIHPDAAGPARTNAMLRSLFAQGFDLRLPLTADPVVFFSRA